MPEGIRIETDRWLSDALGRPTYRVLLSEDPATAGAVTAFLQSATHPGESNAFSMSKFPPLARSPHAFCHQGFRVVDVHTTFERPAKNPGLL